MTQLGIPFQPHSVTSREAARASKSSAGALRVKVLASLLAAETLGTGLTDEEIQDALEMNPSTQRPRRVELINGGLVKDSGMKRATRSGRMAVVWVAVG